MSTSTQNIIDHAGNLKPARAYYRIASEDIINWRVSHQFTLSELTGPFLIQSWQIALPLIDAIQAIRDAWGKPIIINSGYRSPAHQKQLRERGNANAALRSPHCEGLAVDMDTRSHAETKALYDCILDVMPHDFFRTGHKSYAATGNTFLHFDVCPYFYAPGRAWHAKPHPKAWERTKMSW